MGRRDDSDSGSDDDRRRDRKDSKKEKKEKKKDRDRERDKEKDKKRDEGGRRERDRDEKQPPPPPPPPPPPADKVPPPPPPEKGEKPKVSNEGGEIAMSVDETNKMRANLGLKPLQESNEADNRKRDEMAKQIADKRSEDKRLEAEARIEAVRYERLKNQVLPGKSMGEEEDPEVDDTAAWVLKSRRLEEEAKKKQIAEAAKKAAQLNAMDEEAEAEDSDDEAVQKKRYQAAGLTIAHGVDEFAIGQEQIMTLKDRSILDGDDVDSGEDELENAALVEKQKLKRNQDRLKGVNKYTGADDDEFDEDGRPKNKRLLAKYDDDEALAKKTIKLNDAGKFDAKTIERQERIRQRLMAEGAGKVVESLNTGEKKTIAEYYTSQEMVAIRKPKKKVKKVRKRGELGFEPDEDDGKDRGKRTDGPSRKEQEEAQLARVKAASYRLALDTEAVMTDAMIKGTVDLEDVDNDLGGALARCQRLAALDGAVDHASDLAALTREDNEAEEMAGMELEEEAAEDEMQTDEPKASAKAAADDDKLVFTATEEFCRGIQVSKANQGDSRTAQMLHAAELREKMAAEKKKEEEKRAKELAKEELRRQQEEGWVPMDTLDKSKVDDDEEEEESDDDDTVGTLHEKPIGASIVAALDYFKTKEGDISKGRDLIFGGRSNDRKLNMDYDPAENIKFSRKDEFGRELTPKEEFRMLSHKFHGKFPGKMKQEKRLKKFEEEMKLRHCDQADTPLNTMKALYATQQRTQQPFVVLSGANALRGEEEGAAASDIARAAGKRGAKGITIGGGKKLKRSGGGGGGSVIQGGGGSSVIGGSASMIGGSASIVGGRSVIRG